MTFAAYHPIMGRKPVNDLLYEHPFASSISTYCRGSWACATPSGLPDNIGMRCLTVLKMGDRDSRSGGSPGI